MKWDRDSKYRISPTCKKSTVFTQIYEKDNFELKYSETFRHGMITALGSDLDDNLDIEGSNTSSSVEVWNLPLLNFEFFDGVSNLLKLPDTMSAEEKNYLEKIIFDCGVEGIENEGWEHTDSELWFHGCLNIEAL